MYATAAQLAAIRRLRSAHRPPQVNEPGTHDRLLAMQQAMGNQGMQRLLAAQQGRKLEGQGANQSAWWARDWLRRALTPRHFPTGEALHGPYKLWSGKGQAQAAAAPGGYMLHDLRSNQQVLDQLKDMGYANPDLAPWDKAKPLWEKASIKEAVRAGAGETPVASYGLDAHPNPTGTVQSRIELPWVARSAVLPSALMKASGIMNMVVGAQSSTTLEQVAGVAGGAAEVLGGSTYLMGQVAANPAIAQFGSRMASVGGGGALGILSAAQFGRDMEKGDWLSAVGNGTGAASGMLTAGGTLAGSAGLAAGGSVLGAFSAGYGVGTLINNYVLPESWKDNIGAGIYHSLKFLGVDVD